MNEGDGHIQIWYRNRERHIFHFCITFASEFMSGDFFFSQGADGKKVELQDVIVNFTKHSLHMQADDCVAKSDTLENGVACVTVCLYVFNLTVPLQSAM